MNIEISEAPIATVEELGLVPISFTVDRVYDVLPAKQGPAAFVLSECSIEAPYLKNYDDIPGEGPAQWASRFDVSHWGFIRAQSEGRLVGGAVVAFDTDDVAMLDGRRDSCGLVGHTSLAGGSGARRGLRALRSRGGLGCVEKLSGAKIETQNINIGACRFYARQGCELRTVNAFAYPQFPDEVQMLWYKDLVPEEPEHNNLRPAKEISAGTCTRMARRCITRCAQRRWTSQGTGQRGG